MHLIFCQVDDNAPCCALYQMEPQSLGRMQATAFEDAVKRDGLFLTDQQQQGVNLSLVAAKCVVTHAHSAASTPAVASAADGLEHFTCKFRWCRTQPHSLVVL